VLLARLAELMKNTARPDLLALICRRQNEHTNSTNYVREARRRDQPHLLMAAADAQRLGLADGQKVKVTSEAGSVNAALSISDTIRPGAVSLPHGWAHANVSLLTPPKSVDPLSGQAPMSAIAVTVEAVA
jgi:anaerobic selenocysteine-containing dehydrogenase